MIGKLKCNVISFSQGEHLFHEPNHNPENYQLQVPFQVCREANDGNLTIKLHRFNMQSIQGRNPKLQVELV